MNKQTLITIIALAVAGFFFYAGGNPFMAQTNKNASAVGGQGTSTPSESSNSGQLIVQDETVGTGAAAKAGDTLTVDYVGTLADGSKFDSSIDRGTPFSFQLGAGSVIQGWDQGLVGMKVGGKRKLVIPPSLGYGANAIGPIPANSTLTFEVTLHKIGQ